MNIPGLFIFVMKRIIAGIILVTLIKIINSCQGLTEIIPPDFEEKLCVIAILNESKERNKIIIEKSYQREYSADVLAHLEDLSVKIRSESQIVFEYFNAWSENRTDTIQLPDNLEFTPNEKYTLFVSEKNTESITSEIIVPENPSDIEASIEGSVQTFLPPPLECHNPVKSIVFNLKFRSDEDCFYYLDIEGQQIPFYIGIPLNLIDYDIIESNTPCFNTFIYGFRSVGFSSCHETPFLIIPSHTYEPCFFDGKTIPGNTCNIKIKIDLSNGFYDYTKPIVVNLNSIPKELYTFEKSYYTFYETGRDPFSEPVYLTGNIKGGNGIFAICSSKELSLVLPDD